MGEKRDKKKKMKFSSYEDIRKHMMKVQKQKNFNYRSNMSKDAGSYRKKEKKNINKMRNEAKIKKQRTKKKKDKDLKDSKSRKRDKNKKKVKNKQMVIGKNIKKSSKKDKDKNKAKNKRWVRIRRKSRK